MALEQGSLNIMDNGNGTFSTVDKYGRKSHTVSGPNGLNALKDAYGSRIGDVLDSSGNVTETVYEYKETPKKDVDPATLKEVPTMHVEFQRNEDGSIAKDASGKNIVESFGVKYADGTISYTGAGREGVLEAERRRSQAKLHNDFITDARTRDDFASDNEYQNFLTVKNIRIGQGSYVKLQDKQGNSKLVAPNGAVVAEGTEEEIRNAYRQKSNQLNLAMASAERVQSFTANEKRYVMEKQGLANDAEFNAYVRSQMQQSRQALDNIYNSWGTAAQEQGISTEGKMWYTPNLPDLETFVPNVTESAIGYDEWYSTNIQGIKPQEPEEVEPESDTEVEQTIEGTEAGTGEIIVEDTTTDDTTAVGNTDTTTATTGGFYQPFVQTPIATTTTVPGYQTVEGVYPTSGTATTGTTTAPLTTAGLSALPDTTTTYANYTGTTMPNLTSQSQTGYGGQVMYKNPQTGQMLYVTVDSSGTPMTYVPPGFVRADSIVTTQGVADTTTANTVKQEGLGSGITSDTVGSEMMAGAVGSALGTFFNEGGLVEAERSMAAKFLGFKGGDLEKFLESNPAAAAKMGKYRKALRRNMAQGGMVPRATTIENQPHMLAYINPQEAKLLKQRGGTGQPGPGGIPAFQNPEDDTTATEPNIDTSATGIGSVLAGTTGLDAGMTEGSDPYMEQLAAMQRSAVGQTMQPQQANVTMLTPESADFIGDTAGQAVAQAPTQEAAKVADVAQVGVPLTAPTSVMTPATVSDQVQTTTEGLTGVTGTLGTQAQVDAAQQLTSSVSNVEAAQGTATMMQNPVQRKLETDPVTGESELISGVANAETAAKFTEQIDAATATPTKKATVAGQLEGLMQQFEGGETPPWAAGSMRTAMQTLAARGLGASSLAGQAVIQAAMEAALPIAQMDAQTQAQFEAQNLSNRQQRQMLSAQQRAAFLGQEFDQAFQARVQNSARIGDIANMNFTAEQNIALENSRAANTMDLANLNNRQAKVLAEAAALSQLDTANLSNRQQAAVQNAQNFMQMHMANLSNEQQTALFKAQQNIQALFTDQAAENAAAQFNATSENQSNQFFANLSSQVGQFNAAQSNAMDQFNVNSVNALREFNSELQQQRDLFNAQNGLVIAQSNAQWRQNIATMNTAALNESNADFARTMNGLTELNMSQIWQRERDIMSYTFQTMNNNADRATSIAIQNLQNEATKDTAAATKSAGFAKAAGTIIGAIVTG